MGFNTKYLESVASGGVGGEAHAAGELGGLSLSAPPCRRLRVHICYQNIHNECKQLAIPGHNSHKQATQGAEDAILPVAPVV
jgi:hypothetical protein